VGVAPLWAGVGERSDPTFGPKKRALTQAELANRAGVTTATVARIERDEIEPRMTTLRKLAQALEVDPAELVE
jgi:transcriptional regulator with XRE-family HTH domain